jgi:hypothetical protein
MRPEATNLSEAIPLLIRKTGGSGLEALLEAVDEDWRQGVLGSRPVTLDRDPKWLGRIAEWCGWGALLKEVGGIGHVANPGKLLELSSVCRLGSTDRIRFWCDCLFGLTVTDLVVLRSPIPDRAGRVSVSLTGKTLQIDLVYRVIKRLIPAHLIFDAADLSLLCAAPAAAAAVGESQ